jgi:hypothetical protein
MLAEGKKKNAPVSTILELFRQFGIFCFVFHFILLLAYTMYNYFG